ncbi:MAG: hypothetical protein AB1405_10285 [Bdellovibrionota bacterium]
MSAEAAANNADDVGEITGRLPPDPWNDRYERFIVLATESGRIAGLKEAREEYFKRTGAAHTDDPDYGLRMSLFLDWFVFQRKTNGAPTLAERLLPQTEPELRVLERHRHSLFTYHGTKGPFLKLKDWLADEKIQVHPGPLGQFLEKDQFFEARVAETEDGHHLFGPVCIHAAESLKPVKKAVKRVRKETKKDPVERTRRGEEILLLLRELRVKASQYAHVGAKRIYLDGLEKFFSGETTGA